MKLTAKQVENASPKPKEYKIHDGQGLFLRVHPSGAKSWLFSYSIPGSSKLIRMTLGPVNSITLKEARDSIYELRKLVAQGIDPRAARAAQRAENSQAISLQQLFNEWISFLKETKAGKTEDYIIRKERLWDLYFKRSVGAIIAKTAPRSAFATVLDSMAKKGIKQQVRKALSMLNLLFRYAVSRHLLEDNPVQLLRLKDFGCHEQPTRDRALSLEELKKLWVNLDTDIETKQWCLVKTAIKLLILTGARRSEVAGMQWKEIDAERQIWTIPGARTKNGQPHIVYLGYVGISLLTKDFVNGPETHDYVFNSGPKALHISPDSITMFIVGLQAASALGSLQHFTVHDLRRSAATGWGEVLKTPPHVIEKMLNHQPKNRLVAVYQRAVYGEEQKAAWLAWDSLFSGIYLKM